MKFELKRKIDALGRLVLPVDLREYYGISNGGSAVLLPVRDGLQIANTEFFVMDQVPDDAIISIDELGRFVIPSVFREQYQIESKDTLCIVPHDTCVLIYKAESKTE